MGRKVVNWNVPGTKIVNIYNALIQALMLFIIMIIAPINRSGIVPTLKGRYLNLYGSGKIHISFNQGLTSVIPPDPMELTGN